MSDLENTVKDGVAAARLDRPPGARRMPTWFANRRLWLHALRACCLAAPACVCAAQAGEAPYPTRPIRFLVPQPPAGTADILARIIGQKLAE